MGKKSDRSCPRDGERWIHCKGAEYEIVTKALGTEDRVEYVVYKNVTTGEVWVRSLTMFMSCHDNGAWRFERKD